MAVIFSQCEDGFTYFDQVPSTVGVLPPTASNCFSDSELAILSQIITENSMDISSPIELGNQTWSNGKLTALVATYSDSEDGIGVTNKISILPENIGELTNLVSLYLEWHNLTILPSSFVDLSSLKYVYLNNNKITQLPELVGNMSELVILDVGYNKLTSLPIELGGLSSLEYLYIFNNYLSELPESICDLNIDWENTDGSADQLPFFACGGNNLCNEIPTCIVNASFFNISLDQIYYSFHVIDPQNCECECLDCNGICPDSPVYGSFEDLCGICDDNPDNDCEWDCLGDPGGYAQLDECGVCDGDDSACKEYATLALNIQDDGSWNIDYTSQWGLGAFSFKIPNVTVTSYSNIGDAIDNDFLILINDMNVIQGIIFGGASIVSESGTLLNISIDGNPETITEISVSDPNDNEGTLSFYYIDDIPCNNFDCNGQCGGSAILDVCGICSTESTINTYYKDNDCDGYGDPINFVLSCYPTIGYIVDNSDQNDNLFCESNEIDQCDVCDGGNADDLGCGCFEPGPSGCDNICNSTLENDDCGVCDGSNADMDYCGVCSNEDSYELNTCQGCTEENASNYCIDCSLPCGFPDPSLINDCCDYLSVESMLLPTDYDIVNNYPNPFNPETTINYLIPKTSWVSLSIYDLKGKLVTTLVDGVMSPGIYGVLWNGNNFTNKQMSTGIYFAIMRNNEILVSHKLLLMK